MAPMAIMAAGGGILSAAGQLMKGQAEYTASQFNARLLRMQAGQLRQKAVNDAKLAGINARKTIGDMRANYAASGVTMEGSPLDVMEESVRNAQTDIINIKMEGEMSARMREYEAKLETYRGKAARQASYFSAASELMGGGMEAHRYQSLSRG